ncbi:hypothetical protein NL676_027956 [Syzygium grande]|nr:hypothetical protein NL676_027956 [Syzygium grande]
MLSLHGYCLDQCNAPDPRSKTSRLLYALPNSEAGSLPPETWNTISSQPNRASSPSLGGGGGGGGESGADMADDKQSTSIPLTEHSSHSKSGGGGGSNSSLQDPEDVDKSPPSSPNSSTRKACYAVLQSWVSKKFMTGCVVLFPVAVTFFITWWFIQFVDGFFSPIYERLGIDIFGLGFVTSLIFIFFVGIFASSWMGATVFWLGEWFIKRMPFMKHIYSASKQISAAISPDQNTTAFKEVAIIRHPRLGEYAFGFITSTVVLQRDDGDEELCSVYVPTNHLYIGDIFLVNSKEIIRPNLSIREGIEIIVSVGMSMPQVISPIERVPYQCNTIPLDRMM